MDDPTKFESITEYTILVYSIGILIISECIISFFTSRNKGSRSQRRMDRGTVCLIILGWCFSVLVGAFFRSENVPEFMRNWLAPHFIYYIGVACIIIGVIIRCAAVWKLKTAFTLSVQTTDEQKLIQSGLYRFVRNPSYSGSILSLLGVSMAYRHILGPVMVLISCAICYSIRIKVEEKALKMQFGQEFESYCRHTKYRLFPGIY